MLVPSSWKIPQDLRKRVADRVGRQRAIVGDGHLLLVLHQAPKAGIPERKGALFWREPSGEWRANDTGEGSRLLHKHIEAYAKAIDAQEAGFEEADSAVAYHEVLQAISPLNRAGDHMHTVLQTAREAIKGDDKLASMADWAYEVSRAADLVHTDAKNAMDYELARQASVQAEASQKLAVVANRLNVIAALFLPVMAFASVFGMNLASGLNHEQPSTFWGVLIAGLFLGGLICVVVLRAGRSRASGKRDRSRHRR